MEQIKQILDTNGSNTYLYILGVEHIINSAYQTNNGRKIVIHFKCKSTFHRKIVHLISNIYGLTHTSYIPCDQNDRYRYYLNEDFPTDHPDYLPGGGHGPQCQDCSMLWNEIQVKLLVVSGHPLKPSKTIADYWNNKNENKIKMNKTNYTVADKCVCGTIATNYICPNKILLPSHEHLSTNEKGQMFKIDKNDKIILFNVKK